MNNKWMNWFYDINLNDEREQQEFTHILQNNHLIISCLLFAASFISLIWDSFHETISFGTIALFLILFASAVHLSQNVRSFGLNRYYVYSEEEYRATEKKVMTNHLIITLFMALCWLFGTYCAKIASHHSLHFTVDNVIGLIVFTGCYYLFGRALKKQTIIKEYEH